MDPGAQLKAKKPENATCPAAGLLYEDARDDDIEATDRRKKKMEGPILLAQTTGQTRFSAREEQCV